MNDALQHEQEGMQQQHRMMLDPQDMMFARHQHPQSLHQEPLLHASSGGASRAFPSEWFEADQPPVRQPQQQHPTKVYPDSWFEVAQEDEPNHHGRRHDNADNMVVDDEPIRYSPDGELTGKLPPPQRTSSSRGPASLKSDSDSKVSEEKSGEQRVVSNSLHTLGMQLDEETVDFITKQLFNNSGHAASTAEAPGPEGEGH